MQIRVVPTSEATRQLATGLAIPIVDLNEVEGLDLTIDGADEIDRDGQCIKGGGGALLQEKIVAGASGELIIIAGSSKLVNQLGKYPLPVEVIPFGYRQVQKQVLHSGLCRKANLRLDRGKPFVTDHYHYILDCECDKIEDAASFNSALHNIPGVVETGLFVNMARRAIIGYADGRIETINFNRNN
jgi:ribose 5-phosphate isomerase A